MTRRVPEARRFLRDWVLTVLWPGLGFSGLAVTMVSNDLRAEDGIFICLLGTPMVHWFIVGLLQGRLLRESIDRPNAWAISTGGGGSLALIAGVATLVILTLWIDKNSQAGFDPGHPFAFALFGFSGMVAGFILGLLQAAAMQASRREWAYWLGWSAGAGALAFLVQWAGLNVIALLSARGTIGLAQTGFPVAVAGFLLAGALAHNVLTGIALQRLLARRARRRKEALVEPFDWIAAKRGAAEDHERHGHRQDCTGAVKEPISF